MKGKFTDKPSKSITLSKAYMVAQRHGVNVSIPTLLKWIKEQELGYQPGGVGGKWFIYEEKFTDYIKGRINNG